MHRQFDICRNPNKQSRKYAPYLIVLQSDMIETRSTCVVAPLVKRDMFQGAEKLNPVVHVEEKSYLISTAELAGVPRKAIGTVVCNVEEQRDSIVNALDLLFLGI